MNALISRGIIAPALAMALLLSSFASTAQPVFVPDLQLRNQINFRVPGAVDANGYIDPDNPAVAATQSLQFELYDDVDLAGLEAFENLERLQVDGPLALDSVELSVTTAWPAALRMLYIGDYGTAVLPPWPVGLERLYIRSWSTAMGYPDFPAGLDSLDITAPYSIPSFPAIPTGLTYLSLSYVPAMPGPPALPSSLTYLDLGGFTFSTEPVLPAGLTTLRLSNCRIPGGLSTLPSALEVFDVGMRAGQAWPLAFTAWPASLRSISIRASDELTTVPAWPAALSGLTLQDLPLLTGIPALPAGVGYLSLGDLALLPSIPALPGTLRSADLSTLPSLGSLPAWPSAMQVLTLFDLPVSAIPALPASLTALYIDGLPNMHCLPLLPDALFSLEIDTHIYIGLEPLERTGITCLPNLPAGLLLNPIGYSWLYAPAPFGPELLCTVLNSTCDFVNPVAAGSVYWDRNANGVRDGGEPGYPLATVHVVPGAYTFGVADDGGFQTPLPVGTYTLTASGTSPYVQSIAPASYTVGLDSATAISTGNDFGVVLQPNVQDLWVDGQFAPARPGFDNIGTIRYRNIGTTVMSGTMSFTFDTDQGWVSANPAPTALSGNTAIWDFTALEVGEERVVHLLLHTDATVALNTPLSHTAVIDPVSTDVTPANNTWALEDVVIGSFDPNDKRVSPQALAPNELQNGAELTYSVRFQNTGTYLAERMLITDTLDARLDVASFRWLGSSHPCRWVMLDGHILRVVFDGIMLPDSTTDEPGSHGFVRFTIRTVPGLPDGTELPNVANIYFDFNAPVITEPAVFTVDVTAGIAEAAAPELKLWPNPTNGLLMLEVDDALSGGSAELLDVTGRTVLRSALVGPRPVLDLSPLSSGSYTLRVRVKGRAWSRAVVKH